MTKKRRILSVIMAVAMVASMMFAMTANTYANTDSIDVTVTFQMEGEDMMSVPVTLPVELGRQYSVPEPTDDNSLILSADKISVMDATYAALNEMGCFDPVENELSWYREPLQKDDGTWYVKNWGGQIESMLATPNERTNDPTDQKWWKGNAWMYSTDGGATENLEFATNVEATDGMVIVWNYRYVEKDLTKME